MLPIMLEDEIARPPKANAGEADRFNGILHMLLVRYILSQYRRVSPKAR